MPASQNPDPAETIAAALARLRGRRGPRPPWDGEGPPWMRGGPHAGRGTRRTAATITLRTAPRRGVSPRASPALRGSGSSRALAAAAEPLTASEIAEAIGVDQPRASRLVQQSVQMGFVRREADPDDARRTRIVLTEQGETIVRGFRGDRREAIADALAGVHGRRADGARAPAQQARRRLPR